MGERFDGITSDVAGWLHAVPRYEFAEQRDTLVRWTDAKGPEGEARYRREKNQRSVDGLAGLDSAE